jgi:hypothetical protein
MLCLWGLDVTSLALSRCISGQPAWAAAPGRIRLTVT